MKQSRSVSTAVVVAVACITTGAFASDNDLPVTEPGINVKANIQRLHPVARLQVSAVPQMQGDHDYPMATAVNQAPGKTRGEVRAELANAKREGQGVRIANTYPLDTVGS